MKSYVYKKDADISYVNPLLKIYMVQESAGLGMWHALPRRLKLADTQCGKMKGQNRFEGPDMYIGELC